MTYDLLFLDRGSPTSSKDSQHKEEETQLFSALTWSHNDQRLFIACSNTLHVMRVYKEIPTFSLLAQMAIKTTLKDFQDVEKFCLPDRLKQQLKYCFASTIKSIYPKLSDLRKFVCLPNSERLHCTLKCITTKNNYEYYTLYLEYLGGLIPLLSARSSSKLKPNFVIFDPILTKVKFNKTAKPKKKSPKATKKKERKPAIEITKHIMKLDSTKNENEEHFTTTTVKNNQGSNENCNYLNMTNSFIRPN